MISLALIHALLHGLVISITIALSSSILSLTMAVSLDLLKWLGNSRVNKLICLIMASIRGIPEIVIVFIVYFGLLGLLKTAFGHYVNFPPAIAGVIALTLVYTSFLLPVFDGSKQPISKQEQQSAALMGLTPWQQYRLIIMPQAIRHALPACLNLSVCLLKDTAILSLIGTAEFMNIVQLNAINSGHPFEIYSIACMGYLCLTVPLDTYIKHKQLTAEQSC